MSASAWINRTTGGKGFGGLEGDIARGTGTFNFVSFYALWLAICFALCVGEWMVRREERSIRSRLLLSLSTLGCIICPIAAAERTSVAFLAIVMAGAAFVSILQRNVRNIVLLALLFLSIPVAVGAAYILSPQEFQAFNKRLTSTHNEHEAAGRIAN